MRAAVLTCLLVVGTAGCSDGDGAGAPPITAGPVGEVCAPPDPATDPHLGAGRVPPSELDPELVGRLAAAVRADPVVTDALGTDLVLVSAPAPWSEQAGLATDGLVLTMRTSTRRSLPAGVPTWVGQGEGSDEPLTETVTVEPSAPSCYFSAFVRNDATVKFLVPVPDEFGKRYELDRPYTFPQP